MTALATGAAVVPPVPLWFSRKTAIATRGRSAGANATNEVVLTPWRPVSAVPVFPATGIPEIRAAVAVPPATTAFIAVVSSAAVFGDTARPKRSGFVREMTLPSGATIRSTAVGRISTPRLPTAAATIANVAEHRVDRELDRLEERDAAERGRRVVVVHAAPVLLAITGVEEARGERVAPAVERRRGGHHLERRARRVEPLGRTVVERGRRPAGPTDALDRLEVALDEVRVVGGARGEHENPARARLERHDGATSIPERAQRGVLAALVERRDDVVALDRRPAQAVERRVEQRPEVRVGAGQVVVE